MEPGPQHDLLRLVSAGPHLVLLAVVVLAGGLARASMAAAGGDRRRATQREVERRLATRLLWFATIPGAFLVMRHVESPIDGTALTTLAGYGVAALLLVVLLDALPWRLGRRFPALFDERLAPLLRLIELPVLPLATFMAARRAYEPLPEPAAADQELLIGKLIDEAAEEHRIGEPALGAGERELLGRVLRMRETTVRALMQPREALPRLTAGASPREAAELFARSGTARLVVTGRDLDDVLGVLHLKDTFLALRRQRAARGLGRLVRQATFVRDDTPLATLIAGWRRLGGSVSVVRDGTDRVVGLISLADVLRWLLADLPADEAEPRAGEGGP
ncbi:MAG: CBS domain-containing protein [Candidatus Eiseniibacteriota bacterium]|jgi:CBS domain containing-hemolysin-like protein